MKQSIQTRIMDKVTELETLASRAQLTEYNVCYILDNACDQVASLKTKGGRPVYNKREMMTMRGAFIALRTSFGQRADKGFGYWYNGEFYAVSKVQKLCKTTDVLHNTGGVDFDSLQKGVYYFDTLKKYS